MITRFALGTRYPIKKLGDLVQFLDNMRRPVTEADRNPGPYPYYGANGQQGVIDSYLFDEPLVLLAEDGGHFDSPERGIAYRISGKTWVNNHAHVLRPRPGVSIDYLCRALENYDVKPWVTGTTRGKLTKAGASEIEVPFPSLPEQRRIAAILDKADALRARRREAIAKLDQLLQSVFLDMFGDPVTNPKGWPEGSIEIVAATRDAVRCGPFGTQLKVDELVSDGVPLWGIENVRTNKFVQAGSKFVTIEKAKQLKAFSTRPGDVLVTRMGTIGKACVVPENAPEGRISYHLFRVRPDPGRCLPEFLASTISRSGTFMRQLERLAHGAIMAGLNTGLLKDVKFLLPPVELQRQFLDRDQAIEKQLSRHLKALDRHDDQFLSLQALAFSGTL